MALTKVKINLGTQGNLSGSRSIIQSTKSLVSSSAQISTDISGSFTAPSSSFSSRISTMEGSGTAQGIGTSDSPTFNDVTVTGTLTAQEIHTEFESASVLFSSGSTIFGDTSDDIHRMTGSLNVSGAINLNDGNLIVTDKVGIGTNNPSYKLDVHENAETNVVRFFNDGGDQNRDVMILQGGLDSGPGNTRFITFNDGNGDAFGFIQGPAASATDGISFNTTADTSLLTLKGSSVGIGTNDPESVVHILGADSTQSGTSRVQLTITDDAAYNSAQYSGIAFSQKWHSDGRDTPTSAIIGSRDSTSSGQYGGYLTFHTRTQGDNVAERMRIDSSGNVGIGTDNPSYELDVYSSGTADVRISGGTQPRLILYDTGGTSGAKNWDIKVSDDVFQIRNISDDMGSVENVPFTANTNGNVGIGVSPSATNTNHACLEIGGNGSILSYGTQGASGEMDINHNVFYNQAGNYTYLSTDEATRYRQSSGRHEWYVAASGTAGNTISFTEAMRILNDGRIAIKATSLPQDFGSERGHLLISSVDNAGANNYGVLLLQGHSVSNDVATGGIYFYDHSNNTATIQVQRDDSTSKGNIIFYTNDGGGVTKRVEIGSSGETVFGTTSDNNNLRMHGNLRMNAANSISFQNASADETVSLWNGGASNETVLYGSGGIILEGTTNSATSGKGRGQIKATTGLGLNASSTYKSVRTLIGGYQSGILIFHIQSSDNAAATRCQVFAFNADYYDRTVSSISNVPGGNPCGGIDVQIVRDDGSTTSDGGGPYTIQARPSNGSSALTVRLLILGSGG